MSSHIKTPQKKIFQLHYKRYFIVGKHTHLYSLITCPKDCNIIIVVKNPFLTSYYNGVINVCDTTGYCKKISLILSSKVLLNKYLFLPFENELTASYCFNWDFLSCDAVYQTLQSDARGLFCSREERWGYVITIQCRNHMLELHSRSCGDHSKLNSSNN